MSDPATAPETPRPPLLSPPFLRAVCVSAAKQGTDFRTYVSRALAIAMLRDCGLDPTLNLIPEIDELIRLIGKLDDPEPGPPGAP